MLFWLTTFSVVLISSVVGFQAFYVFLYARLIHRKKLDAPIGPKSNEYSPKTAVILCLRGVDPALEDCLKAIFSQDYPQFELHIVCDSKNDPVYDIVTIVLQAQTEKPKQKIHCRLHHLPEIHTNASLKCQSLVYAIGQLDSDVKVIAQIDADAIVSNDWLSQLVAPLVHPNIGATTGNRWFSPQDNGIGAWLRHNWNAAAVVQMSLYQIPWGGSLAIKTETVSKAKLEKYWSRAFCEDTMLTDRLRGIGQSVERVNNVIVNNEESTSLAACLEWIVRQLLTVRLHHRLWPLVCIHGINVGLAFFIPLLTWCIAVMNRQWNEALILTVAIIVFHLLNSLLIVWISNLNTKRISPQTNTRRTANRFVSLLMAPVFQFYCTIQAMLTRRVKWRQLKYHIGQGKVELQEFQPYQLPADHDSNESIC